MSTKRRLLTATGGMAAVTLASRISGLVRDKVVAYLLGAGMVADAFYTAFRIPNMFRQLLAEGALHAAFIPTLAELKTAGDAERSRAFVRAMTSLLLLALPLIVATGILAQGVLNASDRFLVPAATPIGLNLCIVAGTVTAVVALGGRPEWMAAGVLAGGFSQVAVQWLACGRVGLPLVPGRGVFSMREVRTVLAKMAPTVTTLGIYPLTVLLSTRFASEVGEGAVTCIYNASRLNELVYGVVIVQLTTAVLPMLAAEKLASEAAARGTLGFAVRLLSAVALPSAAFSVAAATAMAGAFFGGGRYGEAAVHTTAAALVMYSLGMPFLGLTKLLASASFAWNDTRSPVIASVVNLVVFFALGLALTGPFGVGGVAAATSGGQLANAATLLWLDGRHRRLPGFREVLPAIGRHVAAALAIGVLAFYLNRVAPVPLRTTVGSLAQLSGYALVCGAVYLALLAVLGSEEWQEAREFVRRRRAR